MRYNDLYDFIMNIMSIYFIEVGGRGKDQLPADENQEHRKSAADILLSDIAADMPPLQDNPHDQATGHDQADEVEADWQAAIHARYGGSDIDARGSGEASSSSSSIKRSGSKQNAMNSHGDQVSLTEDDIPLLRSNVATPNPPVDPNRSIRRWIDPSNKRVLAEYPGGRIIALGHSASGYSLNFEHQKNIRQH